MFAACSTGAARRPRTRTPCATRSLRTCSTAAPTCVRYRSSSVTPTCRPPSGTLTSAVSACGRVRRYPPAGAGMIGVTTNPSEPTSSASGGSTRRTGRRRDPRPADRALLAAGEVRGRSRRASGSRRASTRPTSCPTGSSVSSTPSRSSTSNVAYKFETYAIARDQGEHPRRAPIDRLGPPIGACEGT